MLTFLPGPIKGILASIYLTINTIVWCVCLYFFAFLKMLSPHSKFGNFNSVMVTKMAENWAACNEFGLSIFNRIRWQVETSCELDPQRSYLVCSNHVSLVDIVIIMQHVNRRIPFLRFFAKEKLIYVPFLGLAWWALDYPFMKRHSKEYLEKHPEKRNEDMETTKRACDRFRGKNISIINFLEGTRFTKAKQAAQKSSYKHLLKPKAGGIAFVLEAMGEQFHSLLDITVCYPDGHVTIIDLLCGRIQHTILKIEEIKIPREFLGKSYFEDAAYRANLQKWLQEIWQRKDDYLEKYFLKSNQQR